MPQMAPLSWIMLYPYFLFLLYSFIIMIYFMNYNNKFSSYSPVNSKSNNLWQW